MKMLNCMTTRFSLYVDFVICYVLLQAYALLSVWLICFIYLSPFYIDMYLYLNIYYICTFADITIVVLLCLYYFV